MVAAPAVLLDNLGGALFRWNRAGMSDNGHILVVDDQQEICDVVEEYLTGEGYRVSTAHDGAGMRRTMSQSTVDLVRRTNAHKGIELVDRYDGSRALVTASPNQLKQIFLNLIGNARQAMPNGGTVTVDVREDGDWVTASVTDDGPGIEPKLLDRVFEPFFTTKRPSGGTGLGLSVSLGIAESHGGTLTACSEPARGASFTLRLPRTREEDE